MILFAIVRRETADVKDWFIFTFILSRLTITDCRFRAR